MIPNILTYRNHPRQHLSALRLVRSFTPLKLTVLVWMILASFYSQDLNAQFKASAPSQVAVGQQFQLVFELADDGNSFIAPEITDFRVLAGPSQSTSMSIINGSMSRSLSFTFVLQALKQGEFNIGPAKIRSHNKILESNALTIKVVPGKPGSSGSGQQDQGQETEENLIFARLELSKKNVDRGEQIIAAHKVYSRVSIVGHEGWELPSFDGFWKEDVEANSQVKVTNEVIDGVQYQVVELKRSILYPQKAGQITIDPTPIDLVIRQQSRRRGRSIWDMFDGGFQNVRKSVVAPAVTVNVKDLPVVGKPDDFAGLTGDFNMTVEIDKTEVTANDAVNLKVKISGDGNLFQVRAPEFNLPPDIEVYDPKTSDKIKVSGAGITGSRTFEYLLIPRYAGDFEIGPFSFSYFDPQKDKYVTVERDLIALTVEKGEGEPEIGGALNIANKEDLKVIGSDIRFIKQGQYPILSGADHFFRSMLFFALMFIPLLLMVGYFGYRAYISHTVGNETFYKSRAARSVASKRLKTAKKLMKDGDAAVFYEEVQKALSGFVADRFNVQQSEMSKERIKKEFTERQVPESATADYLKALSDAEFARYAGGSGTSPQAIYDQAEKAITSIQDHV